MELRGRRVLVTGASRGIGNALARRFAGAGAVVALVARSRPQLEELAGELGGTAHAADLTDREQLETLIERVEDEAGPVDVLVNNAGLETTKSILDHTAEDVELIYRLNIVAPVELCRQVLPRMLGRGGGHVVNVSSLAGVAVFPGFATYASTKAALTHFTAGLRADLRGKPVGTTVVELGPIVTEMLAGAKDYGPTRDSFERAYRLGMLVDITPEQVAEAAVAAVEAGRRHVRLPRRAGVYSLLAEAPRRLTELFLTGVRHQE